MPEIVEVKKYADFIIKKLKNKYITDIKILNGRYKTHGPFELYNQFKKKLPLKLLDVKTKGKFMYIIFENEYYLCVTLGLSGGWMYSNDDNYKKGKYIIPTFYNRADENQTEAYYDNAMKHLNLQLKAHDGSLFFYDTLSYGTLKIIKGRDKLCKKLKKLGPDVMDPGFTFDVFKQCIHNLFNRANGKNKLIGNVIMDQTVISGLGNYLRADILWLSRISPFRKISKLSDNELQHIYKAIKFLTWATYDIKQGIKLKFVSKNAKLPADYGRNFYVYGEDEDMFGNKVKKDKLHDGTQVRYIHWVPSLQK
ncbi:MAG: formamidopyrimidine-DNA glycosylase [Terrestrivirus sp.]|uniref:Formamidopyrimidine-DNA glycosylase n=1 Tax=Terrestrivirus sp. TaxID=2487775 RepID=A0A3G4ZKK4_9VIRU|nr:MAG: formamidopyrimidine-DNA glycosylase [Terrestrivirus sp.]